MATSLLIFLDGYEPTYAGRAARLLALSARPATTPFPLREFAECVSYCTEYKLSPQGSGIPPVFIRNAINYACQLSRWELAQLTGVEDTTAKQVHALTKMHSPATIARGWMFVTRHQGWFRSWRKWPRWFHIAKRYTPRYAVYLAGLEVFGALAASSDRRRSDSSIDVGAMVNELLPSPAEDNGQTGLYQLSRQILANYRQFVRDTRA
jgi:hypothetical protein